MKILKKPKFTPFYCEACHCEFEIEPDIDTVRCCSRASVHENSPNYWIFETSCPVCGKLCFASVEDNK